MPNLRFNLGKWQYFVYSTLIGCALLFLLIGTIQALYTAHRNASPRRIEQHFEQVIIARLKRVKVVAHHVGCLLKEESPPQVIDEYMTQRGRTILSQMEGAVLIAHHDTMAFWSISYDNDTWVKIQEAGHTVQIHNQWYWVSLDTIKPDWVCASLVMLHSNYPLTNRYLHFHWARSLEFLSGHGTEGLYHLAPSFKKACDTHHTLPHGNAWLTLSYILLILSFAFVPLPRNRKWELPYVAGCIFLLLLLRILFLHSSLLEGTLGHLFSTSLLAFSSTIPSLGDMLLHSLTLLMIVLLAGRLQPFVQTAHGSARRAAIVFYMVWLGLGTFLIFQGHTLCRQMVFNCTFDITPYFLSNLSPYSYIAYVSLLTVASAGFYCTLKGVQGLLTCNPRYLWLTWSVVTILCIGQYLLSIERFPWVNTGVAVGIILIAYSTYRYLVDRGTLFLGYVTGVALLLSLSTSMSITYYYKVKELNIIQESAQSQSNDRDPLIEFSLANLSPILENDETVRGLLRSPQPNLKYLRSYLSHEYFTGQFMNYDYKISFIRDTSQITPLIHHSLQQTTPIEKSRFYGIRKKSARMNYLGVIPYYVKSRGAPVYLIIQLHTKLPNLYWGYPELLTNTPYRHNKPNREYATALYRNGRLVTQQGTYLYPPSLSTYDSLLLNERTLHLKQEKHQHYLSLLPHDTYHDVVIVTLPKLSIFDTISGHVYMFFICIVTLFGVLWLSQIIPLQRMHGRGLSGRIQQFILIASLSLLLLAILGILYIGNTSTRNLERKNEQETLLRSQSAVSSLYLTLSPTERQSFEVINWHLANLANQLHCDINLYSPQGWLMGTSRVAIFSQKLLGKRMPSSAWYQLQYKKSQYILLNEQIGQMHYSSIYATLIVNDTHLGYINIPLFTQPDETQRVILSFISILTSVAAMIFGLLLITVFIFTTRTLQPLHDLQTSMENLSIHGANHPILYSHQDEVGQLVNSYNHMLMALQESTKQLAENERQLAWREMAKQIAHDIKTPLTPIKLSLQYLLSRPDKYTPAWNERFERFAHMLNDQIDTLSHTASSFSNFASLAEGTVTPLVLNDELKQAVTLFSSYQNIQITLNIQPSQGHFVYFDKANFQRMINNLLSNAVQAIGAQPDGKIVISTQLTPKAQIHLTLQDNGGGMTPEIAEKVFQFSFSTKTSGQGLGLSIVKTVIEVANGRIWLENNPSVGCTFHIVLPSNI